MAGLREAAGTLATREASSVELVGAALDRIDAAQSTLNAFRVVRREAAMSEAAAADDRLGAGERAPLLGVPVAIKDDMDLAGETTMFGCAGDFEVKDEDGEVARRLRAAGAVIVGKTTTPEFGQWPIAESTACGVTRNPWNLDHTPGGSSGGSAAAVAAGLVPGAVGSDGAGAGRIPAAWTGLVGVKPQRGRVSTWPEPEAFNGLTCYGPLTRNVEDAALLLDVLTGNRTGDRDAPPVPAEPFAAATRREPRRLRVALSFRAPFSAVPVRLHPEIRAAVERVARVLEDLGHEIDRADPAYGAVGPLFVPRAMAGVADWERRVPDAALLDHRTREAARTGRILRGLVPIARAAEPLLRRRIGAIFRRFDVVLAPTTAAPPLRVGAFDGLSGLKTDQAMSRACPYAYAWNVTGWPGINVPAGLTAAGLPIGAQLLGPANSEPRLLALAQQLQALERWEDRTPAANGSG
jgi:amidase